MVWKIKVPKLCNSRCCFFNCWRGGCLSDLSCHHQCILPEWWIERCTLQLQMSKQMKQFQSLSTAASVNVKRKVNYTRWLMPLRSSWWTELNVLFINCNTVRRTMKSPAPVLYLCDSGRALVKWMYHCVCAHSALNRIWTELHWEELIYVSFKYT